MAKGFKFPAPKGYAKGGMCKPKGAKGYAKGGPARGTNMEASDMYDPSDLRTLEAGQNVPRENKNRMRSESTQYAKAADRLDRAMKYEQSPGNETSSQMKDRMARNKARLDDFIPANVEKSRAMDETGGYAKGGKVKRMAQGGKMRSESTEYAKAADRADRASRFEYEPVNETFQDYRQRMAREIARGRDIIPSINNKRRVEAETGYTDDDFGIDRLSRAPYAKGGKVTMAKTKMGRKFAKVKTAYADGGEVETEQSMSKATKVKMPKGAAPKGRMPRAKAVPVAGRAPVIAPPQAAPMAGGMAPSPLARVARAPAPMPAAGRMGMGMKMGGKAKKR